MFAKSHMVSSHIASAAPIKTTGLDFVDWLDMTGR